MTINSTVNRVSYAGNGVTTAFSFPYLFLANADLVVLSVNDADGVATTLVLNTNYTVTGAGDPAGGVVTITPAPATGKTVVIYRDPAATQLTDYVANDAFPAETHERALDLLTMISQRSRELGSRTLRQPDGDTLNVGTLPAKIARASKYLSFDVDGNPLATPGTTEANPVSAFMATVLDDATAAVARATLGFTDATAKGDILSAAAAGAFTRKAVGSNGDILAPSSGATDGLAWVGAGLALWNGSLAVSAGANAMTVALKTDAGADPSDADPVFVAFRNAAATTGTYTVMKVVVATSVVVSSGSTLGTVSGQAHRIYVVGIDDGGAFRLGVYNPRDDTNKTLKGIQDNETYSSTAEGGAGTADSALVLYTGTAVTSKAVRVLGYFESTQTTAGTWAAEDSKVQVMGPGVRRTGETVQTVRKFYSAVATGTTLIPLDNTIPQNTEGDEYMNVAVTPSSAINLIDISSLFNGAHSSTATSLATALFRDSVADALAAGFAGKDANTDRHVQVSMFHRELAPGVSAVTYKVRAGNQTAGTTTFNGDASTGRLGGVMNSFIAVEEIFV